MEIPQILSIIALAVTVIGGAILKVMFSRAFKSSDDANRALKESIDSFSKTLDEQDKCGRKLELDLNSLQTKFAEFDKLRVKLDSIDALRAEFMEKFERRSEFVREIQILQNQIEMIFKKVDHVDNQLVKRAQPRGTDDENI